MSRHQPLPDNLAECEAAIKKAQSDYDSAEDDKEEAAREMEEADEWLDKLTAHLTNLKNSAVEPDILDRLLHFITLQHGGGDLALITAVIAGESLSRDQTMRLGQLRTMYLL